MAGTLAPFWDSQFFDNNGNPLALGTIDVYAAGTTTRQNTYSDSALTVANANPIVLDSSGYPASGGSPVSIFLSATSYKFVLKTSAGVVVRTVDNVAAYAGFNVNLDVQGVAGEALTAGDGVYLSAGDGGLTVGRWYKWDADLTYASSEATDIGFVVADIASAATGNIRIGGVATKTGLATGTDYYISATAGAVTSIPPTNRRLVGRADSSSSIVLAFGPKTTEVVATAPIDNGVCDGRLTLTSGTAVTTADVTAAASIYFTPYCGNRIALYDGSSAWNVRNFSEITIAVGTLTSGLPYDLFAYDNAGTVAFDSPVAWTNTTTRATALTLQNGIYVKTGATTRRYIGSFYTASTTTTEDSYAKRYLFNYYNRVSRPMRVLEGTDSWTYSTATFRQANGAATNQLDIMVGVSEDGLEASILVPAATNGATARQVEVAIAFDSTSTPDTACIRSYSTLASAGLSFPVMASIRTIPAVGRHTIVWLERGAGTDTQTWVGDDGSTIAQSGIHGLWRC